MRTIWKFPLAVMRNQYVQMPPGAEFLAVQMQDGYPMLWAIVETDFPFEPRDVVMYTTGCFVFPEKPGKHLGTIQLNDGTVFHVFDPPSPHGDKSE